MAITVTEILGTDSISGSRIVINDNFAILRDEINAIETYLDPDAATIDGLNSIQALELKVGPVGNFLLDVSLTDFNINTSVTFTQPSSVLTVNGLIVHNSFGVLDENSYSSGIATVDPIDLLTGSRNYSIKHQSSSDFTIEVGPAYPGQEITFSLEQKGAGDVIITEQISSTFVLGNDNSTSTPTPYTKILLNDVGSTVTLKYIIDSSGNPSFYITGGHNYALAT